MTNFDRNALETLRQLLANPSHFSSWPASLLPPVVRYLLELQQQLQPLYSALGVVGQQPSPGNVVDVEALLAGAQRLHAEAIEATQKKDRSHEALSYLQRHLNTMEILLEGLLEHLSPQDANGVGRVRAALQTALLSVRKAQLRHVGGKVVAMQLQLLEERARRGGSIPAKEVLRILGVQGEAPKEPMPRDLEEARGLEVLKDRMREAFPELLAYTEELEQKLLTGAATHPQPPTDVEQVRANNRMLAGRVLLLEAGLRLAQEVLDKAHEAGGLVKDERFEEQLCLLFPGPGKAAPLAELVEALLNAHQPKLKEEAVRLLIDMARQLAGE